MTSRISTRFVHSFASRLLCSTALALFLPSAANANPTGGQVAAGSASIVQGGSNTLSINQSSQKAIINWQSFSIERGQGTTFYQPNSSAITLNRVTGANPSSILGNLSANGQVWLINPNGIAFGKSARVDVAGLLATTIDITDQDFLAGRYRFSALNHPSAMVTNAGRITVRDTGLAALVAPGVENSGLIQANLGQIQLSSAAAFTVDLYGDGLFNFTLDKQVTQAIKRPDGTTPTAAVSNSGELAATGGKILLTANAAKSVVDHAINMSGVAQATTASVSSTGEITLNGGSEGTVQVAGTLNASGSGVGQDGGTIRVTGSDVNVTSGTHIEASGTSGGSVSVISNGTTSISGAITAKNSSPAGRGGSVETSGHVLSIAGTVDAGQGGSWLLDPYDLTVDATAASTISNTLNAGTNVSLNTSASSTSGPGTPNASGNGDIVVANTISWGTAATFTLSAYRNVVLNDSVVIANTGAGNLIVRADNTGTGIGTVLFDGAARIDFGGSTGTVSIYYNPTNTYTTTASQDIWTTSVYSYAPGGSTPGGGLADDRLRVGGWADLYYSLLQFDLSSLPANATTATIKLYATDPGGYGSTPMNLFRVDNSWDWTTSGTGRDHDRLWWADRPNVTQISTTPLPGAEPGTYYFFDITSLYNSWKSGAVPNFGIELQPVSNNNQWNQFASSRSTDLTAVPQLIVQTAQYSSPADFSTYVITAPGVQNQFTGYMLVNNVTDLQNIQNNLSGNYALGRDIDASATASWNGGAGFNPIGGASAGFVGILNGDGRTVSGLVIQTTGTFAGLIGWLDGTLENITVSNATVSAGVSHYPNTINDIGGLVGYNAYGGTISNAFFSGTVTADVDFSYAGGIAGDNAGQIAASRTAGSVSCSGLVAGAGSACGGLVGFNQASIQTSYASADVSGDNGVSIGGLVAENVGAISESYATGSVTAGANGYNRAGGLVGHNDPGGTVDLSYATGAVGATYIAGGLIGDNGGVGAISRSYATGQVSTGASTWSVGGFIGYASTTPVVSSSYWDIDTTGQTTGVGSSSSSGVVGLTSAQARTQSSYVGWDFANDWFMIDGQTRPFLRSEYSTTITNAHQLQLMSMNLSASYTLGNDIDLGPALAADANGNYPGMWGAGGFVPVGYSSAVTTNSSVPTYGPWTGVNATPAQFIGTFDGQGHTISNLTIDNTGAFNIGLFSQIGSAGTVRNVGLVGGDLTGGGGYQEFGLLAAWNLGTIDNVYVTGSVSVGDATSNVGDLVGWNWGGSINNSYATGNVTGGTGSLNIGGLVGLSGYWLSNGGTIIKSYATGNVIASDGSSAVGGLVGANNSAIIQDSSASGNVTAGNGSDSIGGLVGGANGYWGYGLITASFATGQVTGGTGSTYVGGLVGMNLWSANLTNSYATGNVSGDTDVGGLVGSNGYYAYAAGSTISTSYSTGLVTGTTSVGALVGYNNGASSVSQSYWDSTVNGATPGLGGSGGGSFGATGLTTAQLKAGLPSGFDGSVWGESSTVNTGYPCFLWQAGCTAPVPPTTTVLTWSVADASSTYGALATLGAVTLSGVAAGDIGSVNGVVDLFSGTTLVTLSPSLPAGTYTEDVTSLVGSAAGAYTLSSTGNTSGTLTVNPAALSVVVNSANRYYGDPNPSFSATISGLVLGDDPSVVSGLTFSTAADQTSNVGNYAVSSSGGAAANYIITSRTDGTLSVTPRPIIVTADNRSRVYGDANPTLTYGITSGNLVNSDTLSGALTTSATVTSGVGGYTISQGALAASSNYTLTYVPGTLSVTARPITVTADNLSKTYGDANPSLTYSISVGNLVNGDTLSGGLATSAAATSSVGDYSIIQGSLSASANYLLSYVPGTLTINPKVLTWSVADSTFATGGTPVIGASTLYGVVGTDDVGGTVGVFNGATAVTVSSSTPVGAYTERVVGLTGSASGNYTLASSGNYPGTLTVYSPAPTPSNPATLTWSVANASSTYGDLAALGAVTLTGVWSSDVGSVSGTVGLFNSSNTQVALSPSLPAGTYTEDVVALTGSAANNYILAITGNAAGILTVNPAALSLVVNDATRYYGDSNPTFSATITGFKLGQDQSALSGLTFTTTATQSSNVGPYAITSSGGSNPNYVISSRTDGTLVVNPAPLTVMANNTNRVYGDPNPTFTATITGLKLGQDASVISGMGYVTDATPSSNVGDYAITPSGGVATNYVIVSRVSGVLIVAPRPVTWSVSNITSTYGTPPGLGTITLYNVIGSDNVFGTAHAFQNGVAVPLYTTTPVGSYSEIVVGLLGSAAGNYALASGTPGTLLINPKPLTWSVANATSTYGNIPIPGLASLYGLVGADNVAGIVGVYSNGIPVALSPTTARGSYSEDVIALTGTAANNYLLVSGSSGTLTIEQSAQVTSVAAQISTPSTTQTLAQAPVGVYVAYQFDVGNLVTSETLNQMAWNFTTANSTPATAQTHYIQSGTGAILTADQIRNETFPPGTSFIEEGTGKLVKQSDLVASLNQPGTAVNFTAISQLNTSTSVYGTLAGEGVDITNNVTRKSETCLATDFVMIARAAGAPSATVDDFWTDAKGASREGFSNLKLNVQLSVSGSLENPPLFNKLSPSVPQLTQSNGAGALNALNSGPVLIGGSIAYSGGGTEVHWMLGVGSAMDSNGQQAIVANDPWTGTKVKVDLVSGKVVDIMDPVSGIFYPLLYVINKIPLSPQVINDFGTLPVAPSGKASYEALSTFSAFGANGGYVGVTIH